MQVPTAAPPLMYVAASPVTLKLLPSLYDVDSFIRSSLSTYIFKFSVSIDAVIYSGLNLFILLLSSCSSKNLTSIP